ncbi:MAG: hypothetical protein Q8S31_00560 [Alphaproteobacteria bacterium]|nr:hypothetical protein [Alphaproteobacteria bacterium]
MMRLLFTMLFLGLSLSACGKKGKLVQPGPIGSYPKSYPSLPKSFEPIQKMDEKESNKLSILDSEKAHTLQNN